MSEGTYLKDQSLSTDGPYFLLRTTGVGENVVRDGDLVDAILSERFPHPQGPMWLSQARLDRLTKLERKQLKALGVKDIRAIPTTTIGGEQCR